MPTTSLSDRLIRLALNDQFGLVIPPDEGQPFPVPQLSTSLIAWLVDLTNVFLEQHGRYLCVALMLDLSRRTWGRPEVPTQRCGPDGVCWRWQAEDFSGRGPTMAVAGSYQSTRPLDLDEATALVPPQDGVHLIGVKGDHPGLYAFIRAEGRTVAIDPERLMVDDVVVALDAVADRLTLV